MALRLFILVLSVTGALSTLPRTADAGVRLGILTCKTIPGTRRNLIVNSTVSMDCLFRHTHGEERYRGKGGIALGLDLNYIRDEQIAFTVVSGSAGSPPGALAGKYFGGKASATLGVGAGAAALVGGGENSFSLQPLALEASTGFGLSGGVGYLFLERGQ